MAHRLKAFGAKLLYIDPKPLPTADEQALNAKSVALELLLNRCSVVVLTAPLTAATRHLIGHAVLSRLPHGALLVNVGRGSVVDEEAVADVRRRIEVAPTQSILEVRAGKAPSVAVNR